MPQVFNDLLYLLLEKNLAIASDTKVREFGNGKSFRRVTEEGYSVRCIWIVSPYQRFFKYLTLSSAYFKSFYES
jgi:hypothetical protein